MKGVHTALVMDPKHYQKTTRQSESKTQDIYYREGPVLYKVSPRGFEIISKQEDSFERLTMSHYKVVTLLLNVASQP